MEFVGREILMSMILMTQPWGSEYLDYMGTRFLLVNLARARTYIHIHTYVHTYIYKSVNQLSKFSKKKKKTVPAIIFTAFSFVFGRCIQEF